MINYNYGHDRLGLPSAICHQRWSSALYGSCDKKFSIPTQFRKMGIIFQAPQLKDLPCYFYPLLVYVCTFCFLLWLGYKPCWYLLLYIWAWIVVLYSDQNQILSDLYIYFRFMASIKVFEEFWMKLKGRSLLSDFTHFCEHVTRHFYHKKSQFNFIFNEILLNIRAQ